MAFIIPGDNYKKTPSIDGVVLYKSYMLPKLKYSGVPLYCCFNIYKKGIKEKKELIDEVLFYNFSRTKNTTKIEEENYLKIKCDIRIVAFGTTRILENNDKKLRVRETKIKLPFNNTRLKEKIEWFLDKKKERSVSSGGVTNKELKEFIWDYFPALRKGVDK